jgi:heme-degrading monooxygenase HmoA
VFGEQCPPYKASMNADQPARTPKPPYVAVIFSSQRMPDDGADYAAMADRMVEMAKTMPGYLGVESVRGSDGFGITVSYWKDEESVRHWQQNAEHLEAQRLGREKWYERFETRVCKVERAYGFQKPS